MTRKLDGFVLLGAIDSPSVQVPARREARRHLTQLDQVTQLVGVSEADADVGFMARLLALCSLPRTNPGNRKEYIRRNGPYTLSTSHRDHDPPAVAMVNMPATARPPR